ncbi:hypothetical protein DCS_03770 [Drechmeria coniospora]|uniref:GPI anchored serine-rich protein n=1 Tax=Drechmeria coniospora TaxID=98403 RepID=A0A151GI46_DRECN|nr:hypothetical protein DCS_03770 [Drechmeria coniospora]KYK56764.1 hypothetical protein DCS_03770 [Drechmeria coniospora]ODA78409.1 hypothetical protein RJ55_05790 [Drechmeria coniospora]
MKTSQILGVVAAATSVSAWSWPWESSEEEPVVSMYFGSSVEIPTDHVMTNGVYPSPSSSSFSGISSATQTFGHTTATGSVTPKPTVMTSANSTSMLTSTVLRTITDCPPTVTDCPHRIVTEVVTVCETPKPKATQVPSQPKKDKNVYLTKTQTVVKCSEGVNCVKPTPHVAVPKNATTPFKNRIECGHGGPDCVVPPRPTGTGAHFPGKPVEPPVVAGSARLVGSLGLVAAAAVAVAML